METSVSTVTPCPPGLSSRRPSRNKRRCNPRTASHWRSLSRMRLGVWSVRDGVSVWLSTYVCVWACACVRREESVCLIIFTGFSVPQREQLTASGKVLTKVTLETFLEWKKAKVLIFPHSFSLYRATACVSSALNTHTQDCSYFMDVYLLVLSIVISL